MDGITHKEFQELFGIVKGNQAAVADIRDTLVEVSQGIRSLRKAVIGNGDFKGALEARVQLLEERREVAHSNMAKLKDCVDRMETSSVTSAAEIAHISEKQDEMSIKQDEMDETLGDVLSLLERYRNRAIGIGIGVGLGTGTGLFGLSKIIEALTT